MNQKTYDIIIIGGGIMGSATAYYLAKTDPTLKVAVVERDPTYARASTTLSMSNVRIQFSLKENIQISQYAFEVLDRLINQRFITIAKATFFWLMITMRPRPGALMSCRKAWDAGLSGGPRRK
jgi:glycine/D-amino acid oxidase-like deaminating enzyme